MVSNSKAVGIHRVGDFFQCHSSSQPFYCGLCFSRAGFDFVMVAVVPIAAQPPQVLDLEQQPPASLDLLQMAALVAQQDLVGFKAWQNVDGAPE